MVGGGRAVCVDSGWLHCFMTENEGRVAECSDSRAWQGLTPLLRPSFTAHRHGPWQRGVEMQSLLYLTCLLCKEVRCDIIVQDGED